MSLLKIDEERIFFVFLRVPTSRKTQKRRREKHFNIFMRQENLKKINIFAGTVDSKSLKSRPPRDDDGGCKIVNFTLPGHLTPIKPFLFASAVVKMYHNFTRPSRSIKHSHEKIIDT